MQSRYWSSQKRHHTFFEAKNDWMISFVLALFSISRGTLQQFCFIIIMNFACSYSWVNLVCPKLEGGGGGNKNYFAEKYFLPEMVWNGEKIDQITFSRIKVQSCGPFCDNSSLFFLLFNLRWAVAKLYVSLVLFSSFSFAFFNSDSSLSLFLSSGRCYHPPTQRYHWSRPARKSRMFSPVILFILVYCVWSCFILFK